MRVKIGPYRSWIGPYQLVNLLKYVGIKDEDKLHEIGGKLADTWVGPFLSWIDSKKKRTIKVRIDRYDTWSMDHTLAHIILPMLKQLRKDKQGAPAVDDEDVPVELQRKSAPATKNEWDTDDNFFKRWDWVMDEMIWAFEQKLDDEEGRSQYYDPYPSDEIVNPMKFNVLQEDGSVVEDPREWISAEHLREMGKLNKDKYKVYQARKSNGFRLFGKYFEALWD